MHFTVRCLPCKLDFPCTPTPGDWLQLPVGPPHRISSVRMIFWTVRAERSPNAPFPGPRHATLTTGLLPRTLAFGKKQLFPDSLVHILLWRSSVVGSAWDMCVCVCMCTFTSALQSYWFSLPLSRLGMMYLLYRSTQILYQTTGPYGSV